MKKLICGLLAMGMLLMSGCAGSGEKIKHTEVICPYTIQSQRDGSLKLNLDTRELPGCDWQYEMYWNDVCRVELDKQEKRTVLNLVGLKEGLEEITLRCVQGDDGTDYRFEVNIHVSVDAEGVVSLMHYSHQTLSGKGSGGEETPHPFTWSTDENGVVTLTVECEDSEDWSLLDVESESCQLSDLMYGLDELILQITPLAPGETDAVLTRDDGSEQLPIAITVGNSLEVAVVLGEQSAAEAEDNG